MRVRNRPGAAEYMAKYPQYVVEGPEKWQGKWQERFGNNHPIHIEIGSGKGRFIYEMAKAHPEINYIGIDMQLSILSIALDKLVAEPLPNLQLLRVDGEALTEYFAENEVDLIYLNFSDPWPKKRHAKRRLTYHTYLALYKQILKDDGEIHFKTDNRGLFAFSIESMSQFGMYFTKMNLNLHDEDDEDNIVTEYEKKFSEKGSRIYRMEAKFHKCFE